MNYANALRVNCVSRSELAEAAEILADLSATMQRVYGPGHPLTAKIQRSVELAQRKLAWFGK